VSDRAHFFAYAGNVMRSVIVDFARARQAQRRGGNAEHVTLDNLAESLVTDEDKLVDVHEALARLEATDPGMVRIVEMRFFAGMSESEIAAALSITERTVRREWDRARRLLSVVLRP
jgi:RNA polymerase sigma factor (TIGR02999 family)